MTYDDDILLQADMFTQFYQCYFSKYFSVPPSSLPGTGNSKNKQKFKLLN